MSLLFDTHWATVYLRVEKTKNRRYPFEVTIDGELQAPSIKLKLAQLIREHGGQPLFFCCRKSLDNPPFVVDEELGVMPMAVEESIGNATAFVFFKSRTAALEFADSLKTVDFPDFYRTGEEWEKHISTREAELKEKLLSITRIRTRLFRNQIFHSEDAAQKALRRYSESRKKFEAIA